MNQSKESETLTALFEQELDVINIGLDRFAEDLSAQGVSVTHLDWKPPANGDPELADLLSKLGA